MPKRKTRFRDKWRWWADENDVCLRTPFFCFAAGDPFKDFVTWTYMTGWIFTVIGVGEFRSIRKTVSAFDA